MTKLEELTAMIQEAGLKPMEVLREAKVPKDTFSNWRRKEPKSFETEKKILNAIKIMKDEKENHNNGY